MSNSNIAETIVNPFMVIYRELSDLKNSIILIEHRLRDSGRQDMISIKQASQDYTIGRSTFYAYHKSKDLTLYRFRGKTFVSRSELEKAIKEHPLP